MSEYNVSFRYASSLLDTSIEKKNLDSTFLDVELIASTLTDNPQLERMLENPIIKQDVKLTVLEEIFKTRIGADTLRFLSFVLEKGREEFLLSILNRFISLRDEHLGIVNVDVRTAFEFTEVQTETLKNNLEKYLKKQVRFNFTLDTTIVGGFIAKVGDTVFDASLKHQLELLKKQFLEGGASLN